ncbi:MAG: rod shape-determining protein MreD [Candidatus Glassbacteria bacterium RIFCSPLOWO2_12_FULL_58_11]|uniref:Rod shape-determining protein MreD n=2 Tax=Candidatus Glassiibacteriota TaxID=1817805 RepID=A0A1F5YRS5_9BACT|nr:MAG: rod shape-determining protein MreD [Candidatus Glassbacteria bacterium GWA2_58_10]OGG02794.1 MAG: rod shape-determining protein MreD [Candidatus Glassbacteria bacterium RIFCSPLOWO2_12_FULL_58_11]
MSSFRFFIFLLILFFAHLLLYQYLSVGRIFPDLFLVAVVYCALRLGPTGGSVSGFICGMVQDSFSYTYFGLHSAVKTAVGFAVGKARHSFFSNNYLVQMAIIFAAKIIHDIIFYAFYFSGGEESFWSRIFLETLPSAVYTSVLGVALFIILRIKTATKSL